MSVMGVLHIHSPSTFAWWSTVDYPEEVRQDWLWRFWEAIEQVISQIGGTPYWLTKWHSFRRVAHSITQQQSSLHFCGTRVSLGCTHSYPNRRARSMSAWESTLHGQNARGEGRKSYGMGMAYWPTWITCERSCYWQRVRILQQINGALVLEERVNPYEGWTEITSAKTRGVFPAQSGWNDEVNDIPVWFAPVALKSAV